jgi:hypothetical protein
VSRPAKIDVDRKPLTFGERCRAVPVVDDDGLVEPTGTSNPLRTTDDCLD